MAKKHSLAGKSFFLVGNVFGYLTQSGAKELLEFLGGTVVDRPQEGCYYALGDDEVKKLPSFRQYAPTTVYNAEELLELIYGKLSSDKAPRIVITGTLSTMTRKEAIEAAKAAGFAISTQVRATTTYLVCGRLPTEHKIVSAMEFMIPRLNEDEFMKLIWDNS
jgi:BRCT domain type II-containing protein